MSDNKNEWISPTVIIAFLGLIVSISANVYQYKSSKQKIELAKEKWKLEGQELRNRLEKYENRKREREIYLQKLEQKIVKFNSDIEFCEQEIARGQNGLEVYIRVRLDNSRSKSEKIDAEGKMAYAQDLIDNNKRRREKFISELNKLEIQRSSFLLY